VNRPYYAFGMLLAFLTLAMLAVGLSSRPASRAKHPSAGGGTRLETPRRGLGGPVFVLVVPEQPLLLAIPELGDDIAIDRAICGQSSGQGQAFNHLHGANDQHAGLVSADVSVAPPAFGLASRAPWSTVSGGLTPTTIRMAIDRAAAQNADRQPPAPIDYLSHYDRVYDEAMSQSSLPAMGVSAATPGDTEQGELVALFSTFVPPAELPRLADLPRIAKAEATGESTKTQRTRRWDYEANAIFRGAAQRAWRAVVEARLSDDWDAAEEKAFGKKRRDELLYSPRWEDYEALPVRGDLDLSQPDALVGNSNQPPDVAARDTAPPQPATVGGMSTAEVLQITVASLNRVAEKVGELVAQWLQEAGIEVAIRPVAGQSTN
jgi:hypothetical protein